MSKGLKILLIIASALVVVGFGVFITVLVINDFDISKLNSNRYETNTYYISEDFSNIKIDVEVSNVSFIKTEEEQVKIVCNESERNKYNIAVEDDALVIKASWHSGWQQFFTFFSFKKEMLEVYLPKATYNRLEVKNDVGHVLIPKEFTFTNLQVTSSTGNTELYASANEIVMEMDTGNIKLDSINADNINLKTSTGRHTLTNVTATNNITLRSDTGTIDLTKIRAVNLTAKAETGRLKLNDVIVSNKLNLTTSTGSVILTDSDAEEIYIETSTGTVKGTLLSPKIFHATSELGRVKVPKTTTGGKCEIETETGSITIEIK